MEVTNRSPVAVSWPLSSSVPVTACADSRQWANSMWGRRSGSNARCRRQKPLTPRYAYAPWIRPDSGRGSGRHGA